MNFRKTLLISLALTLLTLSNSSAEPTGECFEKTSRAIFKFNMGFDKAILKPIATGYNKLPEPIKNGTGNFTSNIATLLSIPNYILQGELRSAGDATASFLINSTVGVLGLGNPAKKMGFKSQKEDVGQTLGTYGIGSGCYFVLPLLGPTTVRDTFGMFADSLIDPFTIVTWREKEIFSISGTQMDYIGVKGAGVIDFRGDNMLNFESLEENSIDMYSSMKSIYLQDRDNKIKNSESSNDDDEWSSLDN